MNKKAVALMSGGLDSTIAVRMIHDMGIEIIGVHYTGPFCQCNRGKGGCISFASQQAKDMGIEFITLPLGREYVEIVVNPKHGYGSGANPCMDCRIMMLTKAHELMEQRGASFLVTGEVVGQRPMSQLRHKLDLIERRSGLEGLILRPLCAQHMPETIPEKEGVVDRSKLLAIKGRGRREQIDLAASLEVGDYPCPAGGCLLTDKAFARRIKDMIAHEGLTLADIALLKTGRHFRLESGAKLVVGRNKEENERVERLLLENDIFLEPTNVMGPGALLRTTSEPTADLQTAAAIVTSYCDGDGDKVTVATKCGETTGSIECERTDRSEWTQVAV